jgi:hypothetical protein
MALVAVLLFLLVSAAAANACTATWSGGRGNWSEASKWSPETIPDSEADACIQSGVVEISGSGASVKSLTVGSGATVNIRGTSWVAGGETQRATALFAGSGTFAMGSHISLEATSGGTTAAGAEAKGAGAFLVGGQLAVGGQLETKVSDAEYDVRIKVAGLKIEPSGGLSAASGKLLFIQEGEGAYPWAATNEGSVSVAAGSTMEMQPSFGGSGAFTNAGSFANNGSVVGNGIQWAQMGGSVSGNAIALRSGSTLADTAGTGGFLFDYGTVTLTGKIPAGQTVKELGQPYTSAGKTHYESTVSLGGQQLVNDGTLLLEAPGSEEVGGSVNVEDGSIQNNGTIESRAAETPSRKVQMLASIANEPAGRLEVDGGIFELNGALTTNEGLVTIAPGAVYRIEENGLLANESGGTLSPQISSASSLGVIQLDNPCCFGHGRLTAGGTLAPTLVGGFVPSAGQEFEPILLDGGEFTGSFSVVGNGFTADYRNITGEPPYVGVVYGSTPPKTGPAKTEPAKTEPAHHVSVSAVARIASVSGSGGKLTVKLSCPFGAGACSTVTLTATVTEHLRDGRIIAVTARVHKVNLGTHFRLVKIAAGSTGLAAGGTRTLSILLDSAGRALLAKFGRVTALVRLSERGMTVSTGTVRLTRTGPARKRS